MPQAIQPGSYTSMYSSQLVKTLLMQATQMLAGGGGLGGALGGAMGITNPALIATVDNALNTTVVSLDTQLASVGIGVSSGIPQQTMATVPGAVPTAAPVAKPALPATATAPKPANSITNLPTLGLSALA